MLRVILIGYLYRSILASTPSLVIRMFFSFWYREGTFLLGNLMTYFQVKMGGQRALPASAVSQVTSAQNNQYDKVTYFDEPLYLFRPKRNLFSGFQNLHKARESDLEVIVRNKADSLLLVLGADPAAHTAEHRVQPSSPQQLLKAPSLFGTLPRTHSA